MWNPNLPEVEVPKRKTKKKTKLPKKRGRKKLIRPFESITLGRGLMLNAPLEYSIIMEATGDIAPDADFIEQISYSSPNPYFQSSIFRRALIKYRKNGCTQRNAEKPLTAKEKLRASQRRRQTMYCY